jgi:transcription antitermination factor NusG
VENLLRRGKGEALSQTSIPSAVARPQPWQGDLSFNWYAVYTVPCHEKQVAEHLKVREIEHYLPLYRSTRRWRNRSIVTLELPLFPGYVFVHAWRTDRAKILGVPGIHSIVGTSRGATPLPAIEIESMRNGLCLHNAKPHSFLNVGERARICQGALAGMEGVVLRRKSCTRIVLTLDLIMKSIAVEIDADDLAPLPRSSDLQ